MIYTIYVLLSFIANSLGHGIASRPWTVILCCFLLSALCGLGMIKFEVKDSSAPIWIPSDSKVVNCGSGWWLVKMKFVGLHNGSKSAGLFTKLISSIADRCVCVSYA